MDIAQALWQLLINPNVAYLLLIIGLWSAITAFLMPGTGLPEAIAAVALVLGVTGLAQLPVNFVGAAMIALAFVLFVLEFKIVSHGALTVGGVVSFALGSVFLVRPTESTARREPGGRRPDDAGDGRLFRRGRIGRRCGTFKLADLFQPPTRRSARRASSSSRFRRSAPCRSRASCGPPSPTSRWPPANTSSSRASKDLGCAWRGPSQLIDLAGSATQDPASKGCNNTRREKWISVAFSLPAPVSIC